MKTDLFQSCGHFWVIQICCHIECSTFNKTAFRIWNNSAGIPSPLLACFVVMLPKAHLTSHSRMSGSRWLTTPSWLSGSLRLFFFFNNYLVFLSHLLNISSVSVRSLPFLSFTVLIIAWNVKYQECWLNTKKKFTARHIACTVYAYIFFHDVYLNHQIQYCR